MRIVALALIALSGATAVSGEETKPAGPLPDATRSSAMAARFAPVADRRRHLEAAAGRAAGAGPAGGGGPHHGSAVPAPGLGGQRGRCSCSSSATRRPSGRARLHYFLINKGPWSRLDHNAPFVPGVPRQARGRQLLSGGGDQGGSRGLDEVAARGRAGRGPRASSPPSGAAPTARSPPCPTASSTRASSRARPELLREAAALTQQPTLKAFLTRRAAAFVSNDYYDSRRGLDGAGRVHRAHHRPLRGVRGRVVQLQGRLRGLHHRARRRGDGEAGAVRRRAAGHREPPAHRSRACATRSWARWRPIRVVNVVFTSGDGNRGVQTAAFNLPNDERVVQEKGSKRVMLKNMQEAKFEKVAAAHRPRRPARRRPQGRLLRRLLHAHPHARADARPRARTTSRWAAARRPSAAS